tara:strand:+ start:412 stop:1320 length:909 start_codon:yes stop_codon:yes gene_type:complete
MTISNTQTVSQPLTNVPSISSSATLVELGISKWTGRKLDKRASADVASANYASNGVANVHKKLLGNCSELKDIDTLVGEARTAHYSMTMPWSDTGLRLLTTKAYFKYHETMTKAQASFDDCVNTFLQAYDWEITQAQAKLGDLFNRNDYPTTESLSSKFGFRLSYMPLPDVGDFRLDINTEAQNDIKSHYETYYTTQLNNAMNDIWQRAFKCLSNMSERLDYASNEGKKVFRDTLVTNVVDMVDLLAVCNVTNDIKMEAMRVKLEDTLQGVTPDALREDAYLRAETKKSIDEAIKSLPSLDM